MHTPLQPQISLTNEIKLIGIRHTLNFANYKIVELWKSFMPRKNEISNALSSNLYSVALYSPTYFSEFKPQNEFEKWATLEVSHFDSIPDGMEAMVIPKGLYAVFEYKGLNTDNSVFQYIFGTWLPNSDYLLDQRPHFEVLGQNYKNNDPSSEEEIWIPVRHK